MADGALTDALFDADPREFVATRDRLAKELRDAGRRDDAASIRGLRRPSVAAWALNQVARAQSALIDALLGAVEQARGAQDVVRGGGDPDHLRDALVQRRTALHAVVDAARATIDASGRAPDVAAREIELALQGSLSPAFVAALRRGELSDLDMAGDDGDDLAELLSVSTAVAASPRASEAAEERRRKALDERERLESAVREAAARLARAEDELGDRERAVRVATDERDDARRSLERAETALDRARGEREEAT